jgi:2-amino-4-hydroxy-6-hydroxymethyldihydropteridine diphosphokinase
MTGRTRVAIALGSNVGDRSAHLDFAIEQLGALLDELVVSGVRETAPVGVGPQRPFLNAAASGLAALSTRALLEELLRLERRRGRERPYPGAPRPLDLDLILYGDLVLSEPGLWIPHPRFRNRRFVLEPLAEIEAEMLDPVTGLTVRELLGRLDREESTRAEESG